VFGAVVLVAVNAISFSQALHALGTLGPTVGFLAALLLIAEGCRREGLFEALGQLIARSCRGDERRLLALVFAVATAVTIVLGLDATVVLLPPVVLVTVRSLRTNPRAPLYACAHLANSASLLLPVSNLTNLLAFRASGLSFLHFAGLMALPTAAVVAIEWAIIPHWFGVARGRQRVEDEPPLAGASEPAAARLPRRPLVVVSLALIGFALSSPLGLAPVWIAVAAAVVLNLPALVSGRADVIRLIRVSEPGFLIFVLGLGVIVAAAGRHGLGTAVHAVLPSGDSLPDLLLVVLVSAVLANAVNNLPATLILVPVAAGLGAAPVLAVLIGVNVGPNLTPAGSLATLLWRRVLSGSGVSVSAREFVRLGLTTVPLSLVAATVLLWLVAT
jgi:arsenical pump membrane protein